MNRLGVAAIASTMLLGATAVAGCSVARSLDHIRQTVDSNKATITAFTAGLKSGDATPFQVTYVTTGAASTTVTYAVRPPGEAAFSEQSGASSAAGFRLISNSAGEFSCSSAGGWTCQKLSKANASAQNQIVSIYTPQHWAAFLDGLAVAAGFAGDKVTTSALTVNGFAMRCVDLRANGVKGVSTICSTRQNILGYVRIASTPTAFEIKSYSASPSSALFSLPAGARVTTSNG